ncbi:MAG TPA: NAD(P)H-hydrate dehydratase, partial [Usitatibacter sp.]|nr:NAD(P)H-hydrate dehydratase [Usitatibacter sp.]
MTPVLTLAELRDVEARAAEAGGPPLMGLAGRAVAEHARRLAADTGAPILVVAGPGNNGGDAWVAAATLAASFHRVVVYDVTGAAPRAAEAAAARDAFVSAGGQVLRDWPETLRPALVIDGLLGIGLAREVDAAFAVVIAQINQAGAPVLAIDVPSGVDAATGAVRGIAVRAAHTLTFIANKPGLLTGEALDYRGELACDALGTGSLVTNARGALLEPACVKRWIGPRSRNSHKGRFGLVSVIGGQRGMVGAALLAGRAALLAGAGRVRLGLLSADAPAVDTAYPELMLGSVDDALADGVAVAGPGAGRSPSSTSVSMFERSVLPALIHLARPIVLDADALNAIAFNGALETDLAARSRAPTLLTPHPGEAARLLHRSTAQVNEDRVASAVAIAKRFNAHVVLKGAGSVCAFPDGRWSINATGNPGLATPGSGDVLAGICGAMLARGLEPGRALQYAVCLHGAAADACVA